MPARGAIPGHSHVLRNGWATIMLPRILDSLVWVMFLGGFFENFLAAKNCLTIFVTGKNGPLLGVHFFHDPDEVWVRMNFMGF